MPKTQSALLEAMAERQVTIDGQTLRPPAAVPRARDREPDRVRGRLPAPRGPARPLLPEGAARLPGRGGRARASSSTSRTATRSTGCSPSVGVADLAQLEAALDAVYVDDLVRRWTIKLVRATRELPELAIGASVRGSLALERASRAWALLDGRALHDARGRRADVRARARAPARLLAELHRRVARPLAGRRSWSTSTGAASSSRRRPSSPRERGGRRRAELPARAPLAAGRLGLRASAGGAARASARASPAPGRTGRATTRA